MDCLCGTCKYAEFDYNEKGYFPDGCKKDYPKHSENKWNEVIECEGYKEAELEEDNGRGKQKYYRYFRRGESGYL